MQKQYYFIRQKENFIVKLKKTFKACFFTSLAVVLAKLVGTALRTPGIGFKILGVVLIILCGLSAGGALYQLGFYD